MSAAAQETSILQVRIKNEIKDKAMKNAEATGTTLSALINIFVTKFAAEGVVPFQVGVPNVPNARTRAAMKEIDEGEYELCDTVDDMLEACGVELPGHKKSKKTCAA